MSSCKLYIDSYDTAGNPIFKVDCKCGTTACMRVREFKLTTCDHSWYKCEPETDNIEHCRNCGAHRNPDKDLVRSSGGVMA